MAMSFTFREPRALSVARVGSPTATANGVASRSFSAMVWRPQASRPMT